VTTKSPAPSEAPRETVGAGDVEQNLDDRKTLVDDLLDGARGENADPAPLETLRALPRPFAFSPDEEDTEPTLPAAIFAERLAYWSAHDAEFSTTDAEDEIPRVLKLRKT
jgi:hypothetical protein